MKSIVYVIHLAKVKSEFTKFIQITDSGDIVFNKDNYLHKLNKKWS